MLLPEIGMYSSQSVDKAHSWGDHHTFRFPRLWNEWNTKTSLVVSNTWCACSYTNKHW